MPQTTLNLDAFSHTWGATQHHEMTSYPTCCCCKDPAPNNFWISIFTSFPGHPQNNLLRRFRTTKCYPNTETFFACLVICDQACVRHHLRRRASHDRGRGARPLRCLGNQRRCRPGGGQRAKRSRCPVCRRRWGGGVLQNTRGRILAAAEHSLGRGPEVKRLDGTGRGGHGQ